MKWGIQMTNDEKKNVITLYVSRAFKISINKNHIVYVHKNNTNTISVSLSNNEPEYPMLII